MFMRISVLVASASLLAFASTAYGSDLMIEGPGPIQYAETTTHNWDGPYVGVFGGYSKFQPEFVDFVGIEGVTPQGWLLGVNAGANFTLDNGVVVGIVGDIAWVDAADDETF